MDEDGKIINLDKVILNDIARKVIDTLPEEQKIAILRESFAKTLHEILRPWNVEHAIKDDVNRYMVEHIKRPEIQDRIKKETEKAVDKLMEGVIQSVIISSQDAIKSQYKRFIDKKEEE